MPDPNLLHHPETETTGSATLDATTPSPFGVQVVLQRCGPLDVRVDGDVAALGWSVLLSAAYPAAGEVPGERPWEAFRSWAWRVDGFRLWGRRPEAEDWEDAGLVTADDLLFVPETDPSGLHEAVAARLATLDAARLRTRDDGTREAVEEVVGAEDVRVDEALFGLATRPYPVPQLLGLAFHFRRLVAELSAFDELVAFPTFAEGSSLGPEGRQPDAPSTDDRPGAAYPGEGPDLVAVCAPERRELPPSDGFLDLRTGWVDPRPAGTRLGVGLDRRLADVFDVARRIADALRRRLGAGDASDLPPDDLALLRRAVRATSRDVAGLGLYRDLDGRSLVDDVVERAGEEAGAAREDVERALGDWDDAVDEGAWEAVRRRVLARVEPPADAPLPDAAALLAELDAVLAALAEPVDLLRVVAAQWEAAFAADERLLRLWRESLLPALEDLAADGLLRPRLVASNAGRYLGAVVEALGAGGAALDRILAEAVASAVASRLGGGGDARPAIEATVPEWLRTALAADGTELGETLTGRVAEETPAPHPLAVQVAPLGSSPAANEVRGRVLGYALFLRRHEEGARWRSVSQARLSVETMAGEVVLADATVAPSPLAEQNGLPAGVLAYDNHPLGATSPAADLLRAFALDEDGDDVDDVVRQRFVVPAADGDRNWALCPALRFGKAYDVAACAVLNGGVQASGLGGIVLERDNDRLPPEAPVLEGLTYARRVAVGSPRTPRPAAADADQGPLLLPPIPSTVAPLARELPEPIANDRDGRPLPLLLLHPRPWRRDPRDRRDDPERFRFRVQRPSTDLVTWDRWTYDAELDADPATAAGIRADVWAEVARRADAGELDPAGPSSTPDLDDPAVGAFVVRLARRFPEPRELPPLLVPVAVRGDGTVLERNAGSVPVEVDCALAETASLAHDAEANRVSARVPPGEVWELSIASVVSAVDERFEPGLVGGWLTAGAWEDVELDGEPLRLAAPLRLLVEGAAAPAWREDSATAAAALLRALAPRSLPDRLALDLDAASLAFARDASGVEVYRQLWRWDGRARGAFPFGSVEDGVGLPTADLLAWETGAFAEREDGERGVSPATLRLGEARPRLWEESRSHDPRAAYARFGVRVASRYAGLVPETLETLEGAVLLDDADGPAARRIWRGHLDAARWAGPVPPPLVKMVVPLTEGVGNEPTASLLLQLDEPWYEHAGLAETVEAEIVWTRVGELSRPELAPDPILSAEVVDVRDCAELKDPTDCFTVAARGPLGHTFDTDSEAPRFVASSFFVDPPVKHTEPGADRSWYFARLRFRRVLVAAGVLGARRLESEPTPPYWVQFLPARNQVFVEVAGGEGDGDSVLRRVPISEVDFTVAAGADGAARLTARHGDAEIRAFRAGEDDDGHRQVLGLLTRRVADARGRAAERYVALFALEGSPWSAIDGERELPARGELRLRVVPVQWDPRSRDARPTFSWSLLFTPSPNDETAPRVARARLLPFSTARPVAVVRPAGAAELAVAMTHATETTVTTTSVTSLAAVVAPNPLPLGGSVGAGGVNRPADVAAVKRRLRELGFDWLGSGDALDPTTLDAIRLFQGIVRGYQRPQGAGVDGLVEVDGFTHLWMQAANGPRWTRLSAGDASLGYVNDEVLDPADDHDWGTDWLDRAIAAAGARYRDDYLVAHPQAALLRLNDASRPKGQDSPDHAGHETGLDVDVRLPRTDGQVGGVTWQSSRYDRDATRALLVAFQTEPLRRRVYFNDPQLVADGLCVVVAGHDDHVHFGIGAPSRA